jgi:hypothetical protein
MRLESQQVPLALAMLEIAQAPVPSDHRPVHEFVCYWTAFRNVCSVLAAHSGLRPSFSLRRNGTMRTRRVGQAKIVEVNVPPQEEQLDAAFTHFGHSLKHWLITHPSTRFFVYRTPTLLGEPIQADAFGQPINGVIDVGRMVDRRYPVWSPIDTRLYRQYLAHPQDDNARDPLARQVLDVIHTVGSNLGHDGQRAGPEIGQEVLEKASTLLLGIVRHFVPGGQGERAAPK